MYVWGMGSLICFYMFGEVGLWLGLHFGHSNILDKFLVVICTTCKSFEEIYKMDAEEKRKNDLL